MEASEAHTFPQHRTKTSCGYFDGNASEEIRGDPEDPIAQRTPLDWTFISSIKSKESRVYQSNFVRTYNASANDLHKVNTTLKKFWQIDDVSYKSKGAFTKKEMVASTTGSKSLKFKGGKYEVAIP